MKKGNDIDNLFREGLENPDIPFNDAHWDAMDERLHPKTKRRIAPFIWVTAIGSIAAILAIVFLIMMPAARDKFNASQQVKSNNGKNNNSNSKIHAPNDFERRETKKEKEVDRSANDVIYLDKTTKAKNEYADMEINRGLKKMFSHKADTLINQPEMRILRGNQPARYSLITLDQASGFAALNSDQIYKRAKTDIKSNLKPLKTNKPGMILSILAAPDLTSVESSGQHNLSGSIGVELTVFLTRRLSVTTGGAYSKKIYDSDFSLYKPNSNYVFKEQPSNIHANCDVLDIPLNINYKIFNNNRNGITLITGVSSYLMLHEKYSYLYSNNDQNSRLPRSYEVNNKNQHYFGIANIGLEFQHKINNKLSISARPFIKLPLTRIGYGNSKLSSTGVAVSVNMNLFKR